MKQVSEMSAEEYREHLRIYLGRQRISPYAQRKLSGDSIPPLAKKSFSKKILDKLFRM